MSNIDVLDLTGADRPIAVEQGDSIDLQVRVKRENGNPADLSSANIVFTLAYTKDTWDDPIFQASLGDEYLNWVDEDLCIFNIHIPAESLMDLNFPLRQPKKLICKYRLIYHVTGFTVSEITRTLFSSDFIINRK